jgi:hypothetical protein
LLFSGEKFTTPSALFFQNGDREGGIMLKPGTILPYPFFNKTVLNLAQEEKLVFHIIGEKPAFLISSGVVSFKVFDSEPY